MLISTKNPTYLYVGNVSNSYAASEVSCDFDTLPAGSLAVVKAQSDAYGGREVEEEALETGQLYQVVAKTTDGEVRVSPSFISTDIIAKSLKSYTASTEQVSYFGHNGTAVTGLGTIIAGDTYSLGITLMHTAGMVNNSPEIKHIPYYATNALQSTAAKAMMLSGINLFKRNRDIVVDRIMKTSVANTVAAIAGGNLLYLTNGSKTVLAKDGAVSAGALTISAGVITTDFSTPNISIPSYNGRVFTFDANILGTATGDHNIIIGTTTYTVADTTTAIANATAIVNAINAGTQATATNVDTDGTTPIVTVTITYNDGQYYLPPVVIYSADDAEEAYADVTIISGDSVPVTYVSTNTFTSDTTSSFELDVAWQGPTGYVLRNSTTAATYAGIATADATPLWGLKFSGQPVTPFNPIIENWDKVRFNLFSESFYDLGTEEYKKITATLGSGNWQQIAELENLFQGTDKIRYFADSMTNTREFVTTSGKYYDVISLNFNQTPFISPTTGVAPNNTFSIILAIDKGLAYETLNTVFGLTAV
jgi:hypothetical protein